jgi:hypothetical protein
MPDNKAPYIADDTMRHYDELSQLGKRYHDGDKAVGAVTEYGNKAWGAGNASAHGDYAHSMSMGGVGGGIAGLLHEALRRKTEQEKNQTMGRKFMRYAGKGGLGALAGAGAGSLYTAAMKQADLRGAYLGGTNLGTLGGLAGAGLGGVYGLASGAVGSRKGSRIKDTLMGGLRGAAGGGLLGAGAGAGFGAVAGAHLPASEIINAAKAGKPVGQEALKSRMQGINPATFAGLTTLGTLGGAGLGGLAGGALLSKKQPAEKEEEDTKSAASTWKGVDLAKNPVNWSRTLPKADASAKNWQGAQPGTPAPQAPMTGQQPAAAPPMVPVNQAPPMVPVGAKTAARRPTDSRLSFRTGTPGSLSFTGKKTPLPPKKEEKKEEAKSAGLRNFGAKFAGFNIGDLTKNIPEGIKKVMPAAGAGALGGAALGGLAGLINPGQDDIYDDAGNVVGRQQRSRFGAALRGALGGGAAGGLAGGALEHFRPGTMSQVQSGLNSMRQMYNRNTPMPTKSVQTARTAMTNAGEEPMYDEQLGANAAMQAAQRG